MSAPLIGWPLGCAPLTHGVEDGITWATAPNPLGWAVNGYAQIPAEHPWANVGDHGDLPVEVHGGLTYGMHGEWPPALDTLPAELRASVARLPVTPGRTIEEVAGWVGFDTSHAWDLWTDEALAAAGVTIREAEYRTTRPGRFEMSDPRDRLWTLALVEDEARSLARQIAAAKAVAR